ncbi:response regulator [Lichenibacterium ramalinae]|uniref:Response regulator n=1 Tax=Lichenibacterium ramalinae TaxID=2316527 RepID=A0A4Q2RAG0_9HYPH|nr:response regulator [Lichenibacterium ramalinae]RYB03067.1 response regulator [Lichenibacterium ramalinae]
MVVGKAVLVVEDDPLLRVDAATMFEAAGLWVIEMETADEALAYVRDQAADVGAIFTDVQFPGEADGFDLAGTVAARWPHITVLVTSGRARPPADLPKSVRFVPKPWRPLDVLAAMQNAVTLH